MIPIPDDYELQDPATVPIKKPEFREQARLVAALRRRWFLMPDELRPIVFAVPNGGKRDAREAANLKAQGVLAGIPDLGIMLPKARMIWIEMKAENGRVSAMQADLHPHISALEFPMIVAYSAEDALEQLRNLLCKT